MPDTVNVPTSRAERHQYWRQVIAEYERSQQSVRAFCQQRQVGEHSFYMWRKRLADGPAPVRFALVDTPPRTLHPAADHPSAIELTLTSGERLHIAADTDAATLRTVLSVLREMR